MLPKLTLNHLALLAGLAETGSVSATAIRLGITQSAASHRLKEAERRVGVALVVRGDGSLLLTPEGDRLRAFGDRMLNELVRIEADIESTRSGGKTLVRLGQATYSRYHWLPAFLDFMQARDPDLNFDLSGRATLRPLSSLLEGVVDVSTIYGRPSTSKRFRWHRLANDPLVAVMAPDHPLAAEPMVDSSLIASHRFFTYPFATEPGFEWETLIGRPAVPYSRLIQMPSPESVIDLLRAGYGVALFSRWAIEPELADGTLVARPVGMTLDWWAVTRAEDDDDSPAMRLVRLVLEWSSIETGTGLATLGFKDQTGEIKHPTGQAD
jgi:LysR family transcriptional regulator for metE and metH